MQGKGGGKLCSLAPPAALWYNITIPNKETRDAHALEGPHGVAAEFNRFCGRKDSGDCTGGGHQLNCHQNHSQAGGSDAGPSAYG